MAPNFKELTVEKQIEQKCQSNLHAVSQLADRSNMLLNEGKFELLHLQNEIALKQPYPLSFGKTTHGIQLIPENLE